MFLDQNPVIFPGQEPTKIQGSNQIHAPEKYFPEQRRRWGRGRGGGGVAFPFPVLNAVPDWFKNKI